MKRKIEDVLRLPSNESVSKLVKGSLDGFRVSLQRRLTPAKVAFDVGDFDVEPAGRYTEVFYSGDFWHGGCVLIKREDRIEKKRKKNRREEGLGGIYNIGPEGVAANSSARLCHNSKYCIRSHILSFSLFLFRAVVD